MRITRILVFVFALFFLLGATVFIPHGLVTKWGAEPACAGQPPGRPVGPPVTPRDRIRDALLCQSLNLPR